MQLFTTSEIEYDGKKLKLVWDGYHLYIDSTAKMAKVVTVNDPDASPNGNVGIEFHYDS